jgi:uncharacterized membrane protein YdbT with pleckstrin-like domain
MSYVNAVLGKDETVYYTAEVSLLSYLPLFIAGGLLILISIQNGLGLLFLFGLLAIIVPFINKKTTELVITSRRIIAKVGLIRRHTIEINLNKIESIKVSQGILGRMLNYGELEIVGTGGTKEPIPNIDNPLIFRRKFDEILNS